MNKRKRLSILQTMLLICMPTLILAVYLILTISILNMHSTLTTNINSNLVQTTNNGASDISKWVGELNYVLKTVKNSLETINFKSDAEELAYLKTTPSLHKSCPYGVYGGDANGFYEDGSGWIPDADYIVTQRDWYIDGINNKEVTFGMPYIDAQTGEMIVSASVSLNRPDRNNMVIASDVFLTEVTKSLSNLSVLDSNSGQLILVDTSKSCVISHKNTKYNGHTITKDEKNNLLRTIYNLYDDKDNTVYRKTVSDKDYLITKISIPGTTWQLFSCIERKEAYAPLIQTIYKLNIAGITCLIIFLALITFALIKITKPIKSITNDITKLSNGELNLKLESHKGSYEIASMYNVMNNYMNIMRNTISDISSIANELENNSQSSKYTSEKLSAMAHEQNVSIEKIQTNMNDLSSSMKVFIEEISELFEVVEITNSVGLVASEKMNDTVSITSKGHNDLLSVATVMNDMIHRMQELSDIVKEVESSTDDIRTVMDVIEQMASQTNLLSLNASIEAARAGEAGKGFSIVANEIGRLAEQSKNSAQEVNIIIEKITSEVHHMIEKTKTNVQTIESNYDAMDKACNTFEDIEKNIINTNEALDNIIENIKRVDKVSNNIIKSTQSQSVKIDEVIENIHLLSDDAIVISDNAKNIEESSILTSDSSKVMVEHMKFFNI